MTSVGETLRRERLKLNFDLDHISRELKISRRMLDAIEADQYDRLPGGVFARAFVRQYAKLLGLDAEDLVAQVQRAIEPPAPPSAEQSRSAVISHPLALPKMEQWNSVGDRRFRFSGSLPAAALVVVVMLICSGVYAWIQRPRTAPVTAQATQSTPPAPIRIEPATAPTTAPPPQPTAVEPAPAAQQPSSAGAQQPNSPAAQGPSSPAPQAVPPKPVEATASPAPAGPAGPVHVEIKAEEVVWVLARVDGKFAYTGTMEPNSERVFDGEKDVTLRLGNAGGLTVLLNGKPVGPVGPKGQPRTLQFTSGGFQIVSAKPVAPVAFDPLDRL